MKRVALVIGLVACLPTSESVGQTRAVTAPAAVRDWLQRNPCRVHQPRQGPLDDRPPSPSLIRGHFRGPTHLDWAALCRSGDSALLLIFREGRTEKIDTLERGPAPTEPTRRIYAAPPAEVRMYVTTLPGEGVEPADTVWMTHDGIVDAVDCCGVVWYWHGGQWRQLPGPD